MKNTSWLIILILISFINGCAKTAPVKETHVPDVSGPNVIIITIDTLRADHLPMYGYKGVETPNLAALADDGVLFKQTFSHAPLTLPSHTSIMSGAFPIFHGVRNNGNFFVPDELNTLAEMYKSIGYDTAAFVSAVILDSKFKLDQGFDIYDDEINRSAKGMNKFMVRDRRADETLSRTIKWMKKRKSGKNKKPFFTWIHLYDPHQAYHPPEPFRSKYLQNLYDGEIAFADSELGVFFDYLKKKDIYNDALIALTADHGESLGEHGEQTHGFFIYNATTWVPLIIKLPGGQNAGTQIEELTRHVDIAPTLLDISGANVSKKLTSEIQGVSLKKLITGEEKGLRLLSYAEAFLPHDYHKWAMPRFLRTDKTKFIYLPTKELYDEVEDPMELKNIHEEKSEETEKFREKLVEFVAKYSKGGYQNTRKKVDQETLAQLMALGYIHGKEDLANTDQEKDYLDGPDPKDTIKMQEKMHFVRHMLQRRQFERALAAADEVLAENPKDIQTKQLRAQALTRMRKPEEAIEAYKEIHKMDPMFIQAYMGLARIYIFRKKDFEAAEKEIEAAIALQPQETALWVLRGDMEREKGDMDKALAHYEKAKAGDEVSVQLSVGMGHVYAAKGKLKQAKNYFKDATRINPDDGDAHYNLAVVLDDLGDDEFAEIHYLLALQRGLFKAHLARNNLGGLYGRQGKHREAVAEFRKALKRNPKHVESLYNLGSTLLVTRQIKEAKKSFLQALEIAPDLIPAHMGLAQAFYLSEDLEGAFDSEQNIARIDSANPIPWMNMARIRAQQDLDKQALRFLDAAMARGGEEIRQIITKDQVLGKFLAIN